MCLGGLVTFTYNSRPLCMWNSSIYRVWCCWTALEQRMVDIERWLYLKEIISGLENHTKEVSPSFQNHIDLGDISQKNGQTALQVDRIIFRWLNSKWTVLMETATVIQEEGQHCTNGWGRRTWSWTWLVGTQRGKGSLDSCRVNKELIWTGKLGSAGAGLICLEAEWELREKSMYSCKCQAWE